MKKMKSRLAALLLCLMLLLTGCAKNETPAVQPTLPPAALPENVPLNDSMQTHVSTVLFYLPSQDGVRLTAVPGTAELSISRHSAQSLCQLLFSHEGTEGTLPLPADAALSETEAVEVSGNVATVNLAGSALRLSHEELFTVGQAVANTLCQFGDVQYVNVLINGVQPGLDVAATVPAGCYRQNTRDDLNTLWNRASAARNAQRLTASAALYFPAAGARGVVCEAQDLSFSDLTPAGMMKTLLEALHAGPRTLTGLPAYPDFSAHLLEEPQVIERNGTRRAVLCFDEAFNGAIIENGITRSVMVASVVYTLCTFLPGVDGVEMYIGNEQITSLTPSGIYTGAGETIRFSDGLMQRSDFSAFLLSSCKLYFADDKGMLKMVTRSVPFYESRNVRQIVNQLARGSQSYDSLENLGGVLPEGLRDADLIGVAFEKDTLILNFSQQLVSLCEGMDDQAEKRMIYGLVNTLCELEGVKKVQILVEGTQPNSLAGHLYLPGVFLPNPDMVTQ